MDEPVGLGDDLRMGHAGPGQGGFPARALRDGQRRLWQGVLRALGQLGHRLAGGQQ